MSHPIRLFRARRIITLSPYRPEATHIAVREGRILGVGSESELAAWGAYDIDEQFAEKTLLPGLVEGHAHTLEGVCWNYIYVGYFDRQAPDGRVWPGLKSIEAVIERLREETPNDESSIVAWGFDPIYFEGRRMNRYDLDAVSMERPVVVLHSNVHLVNVNSRVLNLAGVTRDTQVQGIGRDSDGEPSGELQEIAAVFMAFETAGIDPFAESGTEDSLWRYAQSASQQGVTTATDLFNPMTADGVATMQRVTKDPDFPMRLVPAFAGISGAQAESIERLLHLRAEGTEKFKPGIVKMMTDGSIQGFTARIRWPGYYNGAPNGIWNAAPESLREAFIGFHEAGLQVHVHVNGDEASELMLDIVEEALQRHPRPDHRHTFQHAQFMDEAQLRRAKALGICVNFFVNHLYYWGDEHLSQTLGPDRAERLEPLATADRLGLAYAMHSDAPVTPIGPLFSAWCATCRETASGRTLGARERISQYKALRAITLGAAYTLKLDHLIGSLETGKFADMTVIDELPEDNTALRDLPVRATVLGGKVFTLD